MPFCIEQRQQILYLNPRALLLLGDHAESAILTPGDAGMRRLLRADGSEAARESAAWPVQLDTGAATALTFSTAPATFSPLSPAELFDQVHDAIIQTDLDGHVKAWNRGAERVFGYTFGEMAGQHVSLLYFEEDRPDIFRLVMEPVLANGQHEAVLRNRRQDASECWVRLSLSLLRDSTGTPCGIAGYSEDITARLQAEKALQASEKKYKRLFQASPVGIAVWTLGGEVVEANDSFLQMMGWAGAAAPAPRHLPAPRSPSTQPPGHPPFEDEWVRDDGKRIPVLIGLSPEDSADPQVLAFVLDLSLQKKAEHAARETQEFLELALEGANLGVRDWNVATGQVTCDLRWTRMLGYEPDESPPDLAACEALIHPHDLPRVQALRKAHLSGHTPSYESEHRLQHKSGKWMWILDHAKVIERAPDGQALRVVGTHMDISARKEAELALSRSEQRFHAIFDQTFQFIGLLSREGGVLEANRTALTFGGLTREEVVGRPFWDTGWWQISHQAREQLKQAIARAVAGEFVRYEVEVWGAGQMATPIDFSLRPMLDETGRVELIIAEGGDITDYKRSHTLLAAETGRQRLEAVLRSMTKGVVIADPAGNVLSMNPAALTLLGFASEAEARRPILEFTEFQLRDLDSRVINEDEWPLSRALRGETFSGYELEVSRLDKGTRFIANFGAAPVRDDDGRLILVVQTIRDVTRQHETEQALRRSNQERDLALQAGQMCVWRWEHGKGNGSLAAAMVQAATPSPQPDAVLQTIHPDDRERVSEFGRDIETGPSREIEYRILSPGQGYQWQSSRGRTLLSEQGALLGLTGVTWDITERKSAESAMEQMNSSLHQLSGELLRLQDEERRRLARELHDGPVQTLSAAAMNLSVLAHSRNLAAFPNEVRLAQECLGWVKQCSEEMRNLSYLLHPPILDELGLTSALRGWILGFADRTGLEIDLELEEAGRLGAESETALFRIAQEALGNVHRHSRSASASVRLRRAENLIVLEVEDNGTGISEGTLAGRGSSHALGVGIQGMRERARQLDGHLSIRSQPGKTVVSVSLPDPAA